MNKEMTKWIVREIPKENGINLIKVIWVYDLKEDSTNLSVC